jgi:hypothetical protein
MDMNGEITKKDQHDTNNAPKRFLKRNRTAIQGFALLLALVMPFLLYVALQNGDSLLALLAFTLITLSMLLIIMA